MMTFLRAAVDASAIPISVTLLIVACLYLAEARRIAERVGYRPGHRIARTLVGFGYAAVLFQALSVVIAILMVGARIASIDLRIGIFIAQQIIILVWIVFALRSLRSLD